MSPWLLVHLVGCVFIEEYEACGPEVGDLEVGIERLELTFDTCDPRNALPADLCDPETSWTALPVVITESGEYRFDASGASTAAWVYLSDCEGDIMNCDSNADIVDVEWIEAGTRVNVTLGAKDPLGCGAATLVISNLERFPPEVL